MPEVVAVDLSRQRRSRADEGHVAPEHIPELRQLVETGPAEEASRSRHPRIVCELEGGSGDLGMRQQVGQLGLGVGDHGPELEELETSTVKANALLAE